MKSIKDKPKVFCIGWHKTGTTTMGEALMILDYKVVGARLDLANSLLKGKTNEVITVAKQYEAFQDVPWAALFKELDQAFPGSKFILTTRESGKWLTSASKHFGSKYYKLHEWLYGVGILEGSEMIYLKRYQKHYDDVDAYFKNRQEELLIMDFSEKNLWPKLCLFLDAPIPKKKFPYANKGKHNYNIFERIYAKTRDLISPKLRRLILKSLGFRDMRNRFHNQIENERENRNK